MFSRARHLCQNCLIQSSSVTDSIKNITLDAVQLWHKFRKIRNKIVAEIKASKIHFKQRVAEILETNTSNIKTWWKLSKQVSPWRTEQIILSNIMSNTK